MSKTTVLDNASQDCAGGSGVQSKHILGPRHTAVKQRAASRDVIISVWSKNLERSTYTLIRVGKV